MSHGEYGTSGILMPNAGGMLVMLHICQGNSRQGQGRVKRTYRYLEIVALVMRPGRDHWRCFPITLTKPVLFISIAFQTLCSQWHQKVRPLLTLPTTILGPCRPRYLLSFARRQDFSKTQFRFSYCEFYPALSWLSRGIVFMFSLCILTFHRHVIICHDSVNSW